jgi:ankyrin repeat protein
VTLLVNEYKLDVHQREYGGWNALGLAVANNRLECVRCLLRLAGGAKRRCSRTTCARTDTAPALVNAMANDNYGCVYVASHRGHEQCLRLLIEHGADVNVLTNDTGEHPLDAAIAKSRTACIDILKPLTKPEYIYDE